MFAALLHVKKLECSTPFLALLSRVEGMNKATLMPDFHGAQYGLVQSPAPTQQKSCFIS